MKSKEQTLLEEAYMSISQQDKLAPKVGSDKWKGSFAKYDHKHWSRLDDEPLDTEMGKTSGDITKLGKKGDVVFLGRARDGKQYVLYGPITPKKYKEIYSNL
jgi:hypothetical protein